MNNIISQDSWCVTLSGDDRECVWEHNDEDISHHLMIEQIVLGLNCKERCMVEASFRVTSGEEKSSMICQLIPDAVPNCKLSLSFKQVKLKLASGDGPVYITGTHSQEIEDMEEGESDDEEEQAVPKLVDGEASEEDESEEESDDEEGDVDEDKMMEELAAAQANKLKTFMKKDKKAIANSKPGPLSKKAVAAEAKMEVPVEEKVVPVVAKKEAAPAKEEAAPAKEEAAPVKEEAAPVKEVVVEGKEKEAVVEEVDTPAVVAEKSEDVTMESEEDDSDDEADDDDDEEDDDEEDDEDDDEEVESDDDEDDDDEEEEEDDDDAKDAEDESEEESEEEEAAPVSKKRKTEAATPVAVKSNGSKSTPKATSKATSKATPKATPNATPKQAKKPQTPVVAPNLNELKKKLLASPNLPKKYEKFMNLMKNAHKIQSEKEIKNTWEYLQKNKK